MAGPTTTPGNLAPPTADPGGAVAWALNAGLLRADQPVAVGRAPGRLDVMGGIADYTGATVCEWPLADAATAAVQRRDDGRVLAVSHQAQARVDLPMREVAGAEVSALREALNQQRSWGRYVVGCVWWLSEQYADRLDGGVSLAVDSRVPWGAGVSSSAALEVATMAALVRLLDVPLTGLDLAVACQQVEHRIAGAACGLMDQATSVLGRQDRLLLLDCRPAGDVPAHVVDHLPLPGGVAVAGIDSGVCHDVAGDPYTDTRTAAFMAQRMLGLDEKPLAEVDPAHYDRSLRQQLAESIGGGDFLARFRGIADPITTVAPGKTYRPRAAADHHVHEADRVRRFIDHLRGGSPSDLTRAGDLMHQSHRSYGDNAGLGHRMTDRLVALLQQCGSSRGIYGAKITGGGSGGTVAVLLRDDPDAWAALNEVRKAYCSETGREARLLTGSSDGAAAHGTTWHDRADQTDGADT
jgi:L-arabinokinase